MSAWARRRRHSWSDLWVRQLSAARADAGAVLCFPPAGGGASAYRAWLPHLPDDVDLYLVQPPGREDRQDEPPCWDAAAALDGTAQALARHGVRVDVVFGHSLGALLALHFATRYAGVAGGARLVLSSAPPPGPAPEADLATARAGIARTAAGARALAELPPDLRAALENRWLADLRVQLALGLPARPPREPVAVWSGTDDTVSAAELAGWTRFVPVGETRRWPGSHDYPFADSAGPVVAEVVRLARSASGPASRRRPVAGPVEG
jgi:surfactin synthase thioesterase subunit